MVARDEGGEFVDGFGEVHFAGYDGVEPVLDDGPDSCDGAGFARLECFYLVLLGIFLIFSRNDGNGWKAGAERIGAGVLPWKIHGDLCTRTTPRLSG